MDLILRKLLYTILCSLFALFVLVACNQSSTSDDAKEKTIGVTAEKTTSEINTEASEEVNEYQNILLQSSLNYGEAIKGGHYLITVLGAKSTSDNKVDVHLSIKNVRDDKLAINPSEAKFILIDKSTVYKDTIEPVEIQSEEVKDITVSFNVDKIEDDFSFLVDSTADPMPAFWKIDNLK